MNWSEEETATLRRMWTDGVHSRVIGAAIKRSKNAVIGRAHRLGLAIHIDSNSRRMERARDDQPSRPRKSGPRGPYKPRINKTGWRQAGKPSAPTIIRLIDDKIPFEQRKTLLQLGKNDCRFPVGDPTKGFWCNEEFFFCGSPTDGGSYCAEHAARVYNRDFANTSQRERPFRRRPENPEAV